MTMNLGIARVYLNRQSPDCTRWHFSYCREFGVGALYLHARPIRLEIYWNAKEN